MTSEKPVADQAASTEPQPKAVVQSEPAFGWTSYAEIINGRFAMIGFVALLILELFTRQDFFSWLGVR